jgi:hypothetical protein
VIAFQARVIALIWAFWLSPVDSLRQDAGWLIVPTQQTCETTREHLAEMAVQAGERVRISSCQEMNLGELERRRHQPPDDLPPLIVSF